MLRSGIVTGPATRWTRALGYAAALATGLMTAAGFAPWENFRAPLMAFVPLLLLAWFRSPRELFRMGFLAGMITWLIGLSWLLALRHSDIPILVILVGWLALSAYCALYTALFGWAMAHWFRRFGTESLARNALAVLVAPVLWCGLEYGRSVLFTGFPWNPLGVTQVGNLPIVQVAEWGGVYLVSAVVMLFNAAVAFTLARYVDWHRIKPYRPHVELFMGLAVMAVCVLWGRQRYAAFGIQAGNLVVGLVQPAVPQTVKNEENPAPGAAEEALLQSQRQAHATLNDLTARAADLGRSRLRKAPDLIIWPETATLSDPLAGGPYAESLASLARAHGPLLLGSVVGGWSNAYNSAVLLDRDGKPAGRYDKQHLVPFGEFIPLDKWFPTLQRFSPVGWSLHEGREPVVFRLPGGETRFSVTICFEDIFPGLSRRFVREGARLLVNQSNDAWFDGREPVTLFGVPLLPPSSAQHRQHLNHNILRCIENRVPGVRVSNSGASGYIEPNGRVYWAGYFSNEDGQLGRSGPMPEEEVLADVSLVAVPGAGYAPTLYTRWGDGAWAIPCAVATAGWIAAILRAARRKKEGEEA